MAENRKKRLPCWHYRCLLSALFIEITFIGAAISYGMLLFDNSVLNNRSGVIESVNEQEMTYNIDPFKSSEPCRQYTFTFRYDDSSYTKTSPSTKEYNVGDEIMVKFVTAYPGIAIIYDFEAETYNFVALIVCIAAMILTQLIIFNRKVTTPSDNYDYSQPAADDD